MAGVNEHTPDPVLERGDVLQDSQPRPHQLSDRFLVQIRDRDRGQVSASVEPRQPHRVQPIDLVPGPRLVRDQARRDDLAGEAVVTERALQDVAGTGGLIGSCVERPAQPGAGTACAPRSGHPADGRPPGLSPGSRARWPP